jgi:hypothetical protein
MATAQTAQMADVGPWLICPPTGALLTYLASCQYLTSISLSTHNLTHPAQLIRSCRTELRSVWRRLDQASKPCLSWPTCAVATTTLGWLVSRTS